MHYNGRGWRGRGGRGGEIGGKGGLLGAEEQRLLFELPCDVLCLPPSWQGEGATGGRGGEGKGGTAFGVMHVDGPGEGQGGMAGGPERAAGPMGGEMKEGTRALSLPLSPPPRASNCAPVTLSLSRRGLVWGPRSDILLLVPEELWGDGAGRRRTGAEVLRQAWSLARGQVIGGEGGAEGKGGGAKEEGKA
ncbi:hypothetical protein NSK_008086 [Nannochloropsis salina CCMP1776]|uniref:Uncharacterized protein n=1 Tax=Nannochloropsis salina CCMP1776 TaxID=1027361 RepID=A0A4D9CNF0_9STRA|nr:hypothetical protein NSK_008086 [Nannochloropsis salina CCMP1776]|eukprot:TFJ80660.1 hypothetical protein NSK_008086 [Nannochloropsis salina CCMP1776]